MNNKNKIGFQLYTIIIELMLLLLYIMIIMGIIIIK